MRFACAVLVLGFVFAACTISTFGRQAAYAAEAVASETRAGEGQVTPPLDTAEDPAVLVRTALEAEAAGNLQLRDANLRRAIELNPDFAPAHWQLGEILQGNRWLKVEAAAKEAAQAGAVDRYRRLRAVSQPTLDDQLALARWCEQNGLPDQQRVHLLWALMLDSKCREATEKLGMIWVAGSLVPKELAEPLQQHAQEARLSKNEWYLRLRKLQNRCNQRGTQAVEALNDLRAIRDPAAIPWIEKIFGNGDATAGLAVVECLSGMRQQEAVESLVRFAVLSPHAEVREAAANALKSRDMFAYVPLLIQGLNAPIQVDFRWWNQGGMVFGHHLTLSRERPQGDQVYVSTSMASPDASTVVPGTFGTWASGLAMAQAVRDAKAAEKTALDALRASARIKELNGRIIAALRTATGKDFGDDPAKWWKWWYDSNGYYTPSDSGKPETTVNSRYYNYRYIAQAPPPLAAQTRPTSPSSAAPPLIIRPGPGAECCAAGTAVWTVTGPMTIEQIEVGELVVAQAPKTGELALKPVIATTVRPPTELVEIRIANTVVRTTPGHLFWEVGTGWKMAKDLQPGTWVRCLPGSVQIDSVESSESAPTYNLVVADFNTYVITDAQLLVHDNNLRGPNTASLPGLAKQ